MTRRGWRQIDVPTGWVKVIRGPRPQSVEWPKVSQQSRQPGNIRQPAAPPAPKGNSKPSPPERVRRTPDDNRAAALAKIARIQASIQVLGTEDTEELHVLKESLKKAENAAKIPPPQVQIDHALEFIKRARKRLESADDKIAKAAQALRFAQEEKELDMKGIAESEALVKRLREEVDQNLFGASAECGKTVTQVAQFPGDGPPPQWAQELMELRQQVAQLRGEDRTEGGEPCKKRLREDYVPMSTEDLVQWMADRQKDLQEAMLSGRTHDVTRLAQLVAEVAEVSMVAHSVNMVP